MHMPTDSLRCTDLPVNPKDSIAELHDEFLSYRKERIITIKFFYRDEFISVLFMPGLTILIQQLQIPVGPLFHPQS